MGKPEERTLKKMNWKNDQDDGKCGIYDIWKMHRVNDRREMEIRGKHCKGEQM